MHFEQRQQIMKDLKQAQRKRKTKQPCPRCFLNETNCICSKLSILDTKTRVDLVVHYKELKRTTNTGRLIAELLSNQHIWIRGKKDKPLDHSDVISKLYQSLLLYPADDAQELNATFIKTLNPTKPLQLIVPDGNWR